MAEPEYDRRGWRRACAGFLVLSIAPLIAAQAPIALLGSIRGPAEAGLLAVAFALAEVVQFVTLAVSSALAPRIAACHAQAARGQMQGLLVKGARAVLLICTAMAALGIAYGDPLLALLGEGYREGARALGILVGGHALVALLGLPGLVLAMTHQESAAALCNGLSVLATLILCLALIPGQGVDGAALAAAGGLLIRQVLLALAVRARVPVGFTPWTASRPKPGGGQP
jgi:O-antigen/teichoic acid export membrane protein